MPGTRYELRVAGWLSERARRAFPGMRVVPVQPQTSICVELDDGTDLHDLLEQCSGMGLQLVSVRQLPGLPERWEDGDRPDVRGGDAES
jgi:hypothetical protein